ncbi:MAG: ferric reductase-like transmembrane domain-containing protein [Hyphomicrobiaceae bacterium]
MNALGASEIRWARATLIWCTLAAVLAVPFVFALSSPLLAWRDPFYIAAGIAGVIALSLLLVQPLLIGGYLPAMTEYRRRRVHRWVGGVLVLAVVIHVGGLWISSPPDVIDALLFASPTPFSAWGVIAMWSVFAVALLAALRRRLGLRLQTWRICHSLLAIVIVVGTAVHSIQIEGTMEQISKVVLCTLVLLATFKVLFDLRVWADRRRSR